MSNITKQESCPFCHHANNCMVASKSNCWCNKITIPSALIALLPEKLKRTSCICSTCVIAFNKNPALFKRVSLAKSNKNHHVEDETKKNIKSKSLHSRNLHNNGYDFPLLMKNSPALASYVKTNDHNNLSINFSDPKAVKALNTALLTHHYQIVAWDIPQGALCPPIPGRVDYIHYIAELLNINVPKVPNSKTLQKTKLLDIGTGANGIYPLLACKVYGWHCVASDININSLKNVENIITGNPSLKDHLILRHQPNNNYIFNGIIKAGEFFDVTVCNPPFHASLTEALKGSQRKVKNLAKNRGEQTKFDANNKDITLNFGGLENELWCKGGEQLFLKKLIKESKDFSNQCKWFTSLVSKIDNIKPAKKLLKKLGAVDIREIEMLQGNKTTRILAWTYLPDKITSSL